MKSFMICNIAKYYLGNQINGDEKDGARGTCGRGGGETHRSLIGKSGGMRQIGIS
jgi:hypothetical protein